jgi:hypothetical protein
MLSCNVVLLMPATLNKLTHLNSMQKKTGELSPGFELYFCSNKAFTLL